MDRVRIPCCVAGGELDNGYGSEAVAWDVRLGQVAFVHGSLRRGCRQDWPTQFPAWQHVPGRFGALEHEWKDGESWHSANDPEALRLTDSDHSVCVRAEVRIPPLTAIMEGQTNPVCDLLEGLNGAGDIAPEILTDDPAMQVLIRDQPGLKWKALNVKKRLGGGDQKPPA